MQEAFGLSYTRMCAFRALCCANRLDFGAKDPCGSGSVQNSRQRIGFWGTCRVANIIALLVPALFMRSPRGISGPFVKIRSFGESFEALVLQEGRFRRKRGVGETRSEKAGVFVPVGQTPPFENSSKMGGAMLSARCEF